MNEVEKMYENAGIEPTHYDACALEDKYWNNGELANQYGTLDRYLSFECPYYGEGCYSTCEYAYDKDEYPPFTAEKQLELIKWLSTKELKIRTNKQPYAVYIGVLGNDNTCFFGCEGLYFEQTLAEVINHLWQDLTDAERKQIKNILESEVRE